MNTRGVRLPLYIRHGYTRGGAPPIIYQTWIHGGVRPPNYISDMDTRGGVRPPLYIRHGYTGDAPPHYISDMDTRGDAPPIIYQTWIHGRDAPPPKRIPCSSVRHMLTKFAAKLPRTSRLASVFPSRDQHQR